MATTAFGSKFGRPNAIVAGLALLGFVLITTLPSATTGFGQAEVKFSLRSADRFSEVIRTPAANFLVLRAEGSSS